MNIEKTALVEFEVGEKAAPQIKLTGVDPELLRDPQRIRKIMEALDLPEGTKARVAYFGDDVVVR